jgi:DNA-binding CsgD family transcriptional regulator
MSAQGSDASRAGLPVDGPALLARARAGLRAGDVAAAWGACLAAADLGRASGDPFLLADAAVIVPVSAAGAWDLTAQQHALSREALTALGDADPMRAARLRAHLAATANPFTRPVPGTPAPAAEQDDEGVRLDHHARFLQLEAWHAELVGPEHVRERLELADGYFLLAAERPGGDDLAWGHLRRAEALYQLGRRVDLDAELMALAGAVRQLGDPVWRWRLLTTRVSTALLDGDLGAAGELLDEASAAGRECGLEEAPFLDLVLRTQLAIAAGEGLGEVEQRVRAVLAGAPFFARGWHAQVLAALGRWDEVAAIWRALVPHVEQMPRGSQEWLVATAGHARLCADLADADTAPRLYALLSPFDGLHVVGTPQTPPYGPVAYFLGRLAALTGDVPTARRHLQDAVQHCDALHAPLFAAAAREALTALGRQAGPLTAREHEIAVLVAQGLSNRDIGAALHLSTRTVENHVSHVLTKLDLASRAAITRWVMTR